MMMSSRWCFSFANGTFVMIFGTMFFANLDLDKLWGKYISFVLVSCCMDSWKKSVDLIPERNWSPFKRCAWNPKQPCINGCFTWMVPNLYIGNGCLTIFFCWNWLFGVPGGHKSLGKPIQTDPLFLASMASTAGRGCAKFPLRSHIPVRVQRQP